MKPDFIIGGIAKNGTSYLHSLMKRHPHIDLPERSMDYSFFDNDVIYKKGFNWYQSIFEGLDNTKVIGQVSADSAFNPGSIERIKKYLPEVKLIFVFRNPVDSVYSLYWHQVKMGREYRNFEEALRYGDKKAKKSYYNFKMFSYIERYRISKFSKNIKSHFNDNQILFIPFEVFIKDELNVLNKVFRFIDVDQINDLSEIVSGKVHKNKAKLPKYKSVVWLSYYLQELSYKIKQPKLKKIGRFLLNKTLVEKRSPKMTPKTRKYLEDFLTDDIKFHNNLVKDFSPLDI